MHIYFNARSNQKIGRPNDNTDARGDPSSTTEMSPTRVCSTYSAKAFEYFRMLVNVNCSPVRRVAHAIALFVIFVRSCVPAKIISHTFLYVRYCNAVALLSKLCSESSKRTRFFQYDNTSEIRQRRGDDSIVTISAA